MMQMLAVYRCRRPAAPCNTPLPSNPCSWLVPAHMACTLPSPAHVAAAAPQLQAPQGPARPTRSNWCWMRWGSAWSVSRTRRWVGRLQRACMLTWTWYLRGAAAAAAVHHRIPRGVGGLPALPGLASVARCCNSHHARAAACAVDRVPAQQQAVRVRVRRRRLR